MALPAWVNYGEAERSAAVMAREMSGASASWAELLANAQTVLAHRSDTRDSEHLSTYGFDDWRDLVSAARILDLASTEKGFSDPEARRASAILSACAFGMSGTAVSAKAVIDSHRLLGSELTQGELTALALSSPAMCREVFLRLESGTSYRACIESVVGYLATGSQERFVAAQESLEQAITNEYSSWESYLLRLSRLCLAHLGRLATANVLGGFENQLPTGYINRLVADSPMLLPSQYESISGHEVLNPESNLLVALPTGTGKTLVGELALISCLGKNPGVVCYVAPYVALGRQVANRISRHTPEDVVVRTLVGGYREADLLDAEGRSVVVIATPERLDAMLRLHREVLPLIRCVVFDEAHIIENGQRGARIEGIITRLRLSGLRTPISPRLVLLSAVLSNVEALARWLGIEDANVIRGTWRPSANRTQRWTEDGRLRMHAGDDPLRSVPSEVLGETTLPWPNRGFYPASHIGQVNQQEPLALGNVAYLAEYVLDQYKQPVLCICTSRPRTRRLAAQVADRLELIEPLPAVIREITDLIDARFQYLQPLKDALQRGVAYHNASLPHLVRAGIERAAEARALKVVTATTTLAEGVDLPFRVTILADWLTFDGERNNPMQSLLFKNIAGRCGRAGQFTEGDTVIFDNPVGDAQLTSPARRPDLQREIFFAETQPTLESAIVRLGHQGATSIVGSQLLASIPENPGSDDLVSSFFANSFAYQTRGRQAAWEVMSRAFQEILDDTGDWPLAVAASPAKLTPFGEAANATGLSPGTARKLRSTLSEFQEAGASRDDLLEIGVALLKSLADAPEQRNVELRKAVANPKSRPIVKVDDLRLVLDGWLEGKSIEVLFSEIPSHRRSSRRPNLQAWLRGVSTDSSWNDQFTKFNDYISDCFEFFLSWLLNAVQPLAEMDNHPERPWLDWARYVELGVDSSWAVKMLDAEIITDRGVARAMGKRFDEFENSLNVSFEQVFHAVSSLAGLGESDVLQVATWYQQQTLRISDSSTG